MGENDSLWSDVVFEKEVISSQFSLLKAHKCYATRMYFLSYFLQFGWQKGHKVLQISYFIRMLGYTKGECWQLPNVSSAFKFQGNHFTLAHRYQSALTRNKMTTMEITFCVILSKQIFCFLSGFYLNVYFPLLTPCTRVIRGDWCRAHHFGGQLHVGLHVLTPRRLKCTLHCIMHGMKMHSEIAQLWKIWRIQDFSDGDVRWNGSILYKFACP